MPGYLPSFPDNSVTPTISSNSGDTAFSVDSLTGFSLNGPLSGKKGYECAGGISECANSCCSIQGFCSDTQYSCGEKRDNKNLIYIITCSLFGAFTIFYWVTYFVIGCRYNKQAIKTQKEKQRYGEVVKQNQQRKKNEVINENDEFDVPGMRTHGSVSVEEEKPDEEKRKKMENVANKLDRLEQNKYEEKGEKGSDLIDESNRGGKEKKIEGEFDEQNLDD